VDVRYRGQGYELNLPYSPGLIRNFRDEHQRRYGYSYPGREVELVTLRMRTSLRSPQANVAADGNRETTDKQKSELARVFFDGNQVRATMYQRESLPVGKRIRGPAVIAEYSATTVISPGHHFLLDRAGNLIVTI
jgi:N-methylhydantoinase A